MSSRWFRFYSEALDDPKVQRLDPPTFKHWVNLLCLAAKNDGRLPSEDDIAFALRIDNIGVVSLLDRLLNAGLIDVCKGGANGSYIAPHNWSKRQYKSDTSTDRVKRFRKRSKAVTETGDETPPETEQNRTEYIEPNGSCAASGTPEDDFTFSDFEEAWAEVSKACGLPAMRAGARDRRRRAFSVRKRQYPDMADWQTAFATLRKARWMHGDNRQGWRCDADDFLNPQKFSRLVEGSYAETN